MAAAAKTKKSPTKTEILNNIADESGLSKKEVAAVFDALSDEIRKNLGRRGAGAFTIPGLLKIEKKRPPMNSGFPAGTTGTPSSSGSRPTAVPARGAAHAAASSATIDWLSKRELTTTRSAAR